MKILICFIFLLLFSFEAFSEEVIRVGLEEAKPIISQEPQGIIEKILGEVEKRTDFKFKISYMTYGRALVELKKGRIDLIGITPTGNETEDFYQFASDLEWSFETYNALFFLKKNSHFKYMVDFKEIGTPSGNEAFMAELLKVKEKTFHGGKLNSLFQMLEKGRVDAVLFEAISSLTLLRKLKYQDITYRLVNPMRGGLSVSKKRPLLKAKLDKAINDIQWNKYFQELSVIEDLKRASFMEIRPPKK